MLALGPLLGPNEYVIDAWWEHADVGIGLYQRAFVQSHVHRIIIIPSSLGGNGQIRVGFPSLPLWTDNVLPNLGVECNLFNPLLPAPQYHTFIVDAVLDHLYWSAIAATNHGFQVVVVGKTSDSTLSVARTLNDPQDR